MRNCFLIDGKTINSADDVFAGLTIQSNLIISNCRILLEELHFPRQIMNVFIVGCSCNNELLMQSYNENTELRFEYGNSFQSVKISGSYGRVLFNSGPLFSRVPYPETFQPSNFGVIYFLAEARAKRLDFTCISANSIKYNGFASDVFMDEVNVSDDVTFISKEEISIFLIRTTCKDLNFDGNFKFINLNSEFKIGSLYFNVRQSVMKNVSIDLQNSSIYDKLIFANASDNKSSQFILKNAEFASIKSLVLHQSLLSCFVISNCDLTKTEVSFINCRLDDLLTEGVSWPFDIEVNHSSARKTPYLEQDQKQAIYRQLKSISQKNKDTDNFYFFRRKEYDTTLSILSCKLVLFLNYFLTVLCDLIGVARERHLPIIDKLNYKNKFSGFVATLSNWLVLKLSSLISLHGTSLFRPLLILVIGIPFSLYFLGYYESIEQLMALSAYVIDPTHKLEASIMGKTIILNPMHSLFFKVFSSTILFKIVMVFRKYSVSV